MGYSASFNGTLELVAAQEAAAALHALTPTHSIVDNPADAIANLLTEWLPLEECNVHVSAPEGSADVGHPLLSLSGYGKLHSEEMAFDAIAEHVRGCIEFTGEDDSSWRVRFTGGAPVEDAGVIVYDCDELDRVDGIWIGQMSSHLPGELDIIVTATSHWSAQKKLATKCRHLLDVHTPGKAGNPEGLADAEVIAAWTAASGVRSSIHSESDESRLERMF